MSGLVGNLDSDCVLARYRSNNTNARHTQGDGQVVSQAGDFRQSQPSFEFDFVLRDHWTGFDFYDAHVEAKVLEGLLKDLGFPADFYRLAFKVDVFTFKQ